jgi:hypothetical protein
MYNSDFIICLGRQEGIKQGNKADVRRLSVIKQCIGPRQCERGNARESQSEEAKRSRLRCDVHVCMM